MTTRRTLLRAGAASWAVLAAPNVARAAAARVVVVGGGFGGATAARELKRRDPALRVTLIEREERIHTCPFSNAVLAGLIELPAITHGLDDLRRAGIDVIHATAHDVDAAAKHVTVEGRVLGYDRLVLSPGIDLRWGALDGYDEAAASLAPHAWKAGEQTLLLRRQLEAMEDGGLVVITVPDNPYRCPPGPYERAGLIAHYLKTRKPRSKILVLDAKDSFSKQSLFFEGWKALYGSMVEWVGRANDGTVTRIDARGRVAITDFGTAHEAAVLNVIPPQMAGRLAARAGLTDDSGWVPVKPETFEARKAEGIHVIGDAAQAAPMPKSGFCASAQAKVVAAAIVAELHGRPAPTPSWINTCYSLVGPDYGISIADVYRVSGGSLATVPNAGGVSPLGAPAAFRAAEARYAEGWYRSISDDVWGPPSR